jgi:phenylacetic acid degradation operon negative regulatory protein
VFYEFTPQLEHLLAEGDRQIFGLGVADEHSGEWTVVWQAVPDELGTERRRLARRLRFLGFGLVQSGTWVSPHDRVREIDTVLNDLGIEQYVGVIVGRPATPDALQTLTSQAWDLDALSERYVRFREEVGRYQSVRERQRLTDRDAFLVRTRVVHRFRQFPFHDPGLPEELLGRPTPRREAVALFHHVYESLALPAQRHFDFVMSDGPPATGA